MRKVDFGPLITAAVTPFDKDGKIDIDGFKNLLDHLIASKSSGIVVSGTTGEACVLNGLERLKIWEAAVDHVEGKVPIIAGGGTNNTKTTLHNVKLAEEVGVDGLLVVTPYYNRPSAKGLLAHFKRVAAETDLPIILYDVPKRTGVKFELETVLELAEVEHIVGIKDARGDLVLSRELKARLGNEFLVYSGDDGLFLDNLKIGGDGVISVASHLVGMKMSAIYEAYVAGDLELAEAVDQELASFYEAIFMYPNPVGIKALLNLCGIPVGDVRLPLVGLDEDETDALSQRVGRFV